MYWSFNSLVELFIQLEIDIEIHHLQITIDLLIDKWEILIDDLCLDSTIFEEL